MSYSASKQSSPSVTMNITSIHWYNFRCGMGFLYPRFSISATGRSEPTKDIQTVLVSFSNSVRIWELWSWRPVHVLNFKFWLDSHRSCAGMAEQLELIGGVWACHRLEEVWFLPEIRVLFPVIFTVSWDLAIFWFWFLWSPCGIGQTIIFSCCSLFFFFFFFFPHLISAGTDWMSAILPHMVWP